MKKYELKPVYTNQQSFYKKAYVIEDDREPHEKYVLLSYDTKVAYIDENGVPHLLDKYNYSNTTLRHVREFIQQAGYQIAPAQKLFKMYGNFHIHEKYEKAKSYRTYN